MAAERTTVDFEPEAPSTGVKPCVDRAAAAPRPVRDRAGVRSRRDPRHEEAIMTATPLRLSTPTVVCELGASSADATLEYASSYCKARGARLVVVRVVEPESLQSTYGQGGGPGTFGLIGAEALVRDAVHRHGLDARVVVRFGERGSVLEEERLAAAAERVITASDVPPEWCPACGARYDARAVHFCPSVHLDRQLPAQARPSAA
jgi:hypothetical protein